jgi:hypothetical protein
LIKAVALRDSTGYGIVWDEDAEARGASLAVARLATLGTQAGEHTMQATKGDRLHVHSNTVGTRDKIAEIV